MSTPFNPNSPQVTWTIYVLRLESDKYYVGRTKNFRQRLLSHFENDGSEWTRRYKYLDVAETRSNCDSFDEDKVTKQYMLKYGINKVRGGSYSQIELTSQQIELLIKEFQSATDICFRCGSNSHFISACFAKRWKCIMCSIYNDNIQSNKCGTCQYNNPNVDSKLTNRLESNSSNTSTISPSPIKPNNTRDVEATEFKGDICHRCGRPGHLEKDCYATTDVDGHRLPQ